MLSQKNVLWHVDITRDVKEMEKYNACLLTASVSQSVKECYELYIKDMF